MLFTLNDCPHSLLPCTLSSSSYQSHLHLTITTSFTAPLCDHSLQPHAVRPRRTCRACSAALLCYMA